MRRLLKLWCDFVGHRRQMAYDSSDDYKLVFWCSRCHEVLDS